MYKAHMTYIGKATLQNRETNSIMQRLLEKNYAMSNWSSVKLQFYQSFDMYMYNHLNIKLVNTCTVNMFVLFFIEVTMMIMYQ